MIPVRQIEEVLSIARSSGADFAEIYLEDRNDTILKCVNRVVNGATSLHIHGAGIYVLNGLNSVYVYTNDTSYLSLRALAENASNLIKFIAKSSEVQRKPIVLSYEKHASPCIAEISPNTVNINKKASVIRDMDFAARNAGPVVRSLETAYFDQVQNVIIANSEGLYTGDTRVFTRTRLSACVEWNNHIEYGYADYTGAKGFEIFSGSMDYTRFAQAHIHDLEQSMRALPVKSCVVPVVFERGAAGTLWHEACGHNLETTNISLGSGDFGNKMGQKVADERVTLVDDGTIPGLYGSEAIDDEGCPTQKNILIENGVIKDFLCDRIGARRFNLKQNGSGRRQSYKFAPAARMHNTYLAPGNDDDDEIISSLPEGLYVKELGGGKSGSVFSIAVKEGYWIKNGQISHRVKGVTLSGSSSEIIKKVDRVGKILEPERGGAFCGSSSGLVPVTAFQPRARICAMNVAGTEE